MKTADFAKFLSKLPSRETGSMGSSGTVIYIDGQIMPSENFRSSYQYTTTVECDEDANEKFATERLAPGVAVVINEYDYFKNPPTEHYSLFTLKKGQWVS